MSGPKVHRLPCSAGFPSAHAQPCVAPAEGSLVPPPGPHRPEVSAVLASIAADWSWNFLQGEAHSTHTFASGSFCLGCLSSHCLAVFLPTYNVVYESLVVSSLGLLCIKLL